MGEIATGPACFVVLGDPHSQTAHQTPHITCISSCSRAACKPLLHNLCTAAHRSLQGSCTRQCAAGLPLLRAFAQLQRERTAQPCVDTENRNLAPESTLCDLLVRRPAARRNSRSAPLCAKLHAYMNGKTKLNFGNEPFQNVEPSQPRLLLLRAQASCAARCPLCSLRTASRSHRRTTSPRCRWISCRTLPLRTSASGVTQHQHCLMMEMREFHAMPCLQDKCSAFWRGESY